MARRVKFESDNAEALRSSLTGENVNDLNGFILSNLDVQSLCLAARSSHAMSIRCRDPHIWTRLYDARWKTRVGIPPGFRPSRRHYIQRAVVLRKQEPMSPCTHQYPDATYSFSLQVTAPASGTVLFEGTSTITLQDNDAKLPKMLIQNRAEPAGPRPQDETVKASLIISRDSDQALAKAWELEQPSWTRSGDINQYCMANYESSSRDCLSSMDVMTPLPHATDGPGAHAARSLMLPIKLNLDERQLFDYSASGLLEVVELMPRIWSGSSAECVPHSRLLESGHELTSALSLAALQWHAF